MEHFNFFINDHYPVIIRNVIVLCFCFTLVFIAIGLDLVAGVYKAKQRKELRSSYGFNRTVAKFSFRFSALFLAFMADAVINFVIVTYNNFIPPIPYLTIILSFYIIAFVEGRSLFEKAGDKQTKQVNKDVANALEIIAHLGNKEDLIAVLKSKIEEANTKELES